MYILGMMSGTSVDALDFAMIETDGEAVQHFGKTGSGAYRDGLATQILAAAAAKGGTPKQQTELSRKIAEDHAAEYHRFVKQLDRKPDLIGFHGQTVWHDPAQGITLQLGDAQLLANLTQIPVIADFRSADICAGGQGAPLAPIFHQAIAHSWPKPCAVVNIGGVANVTWIEADQTISALDVGPGNALLDDWVRKHTSLPYDQDGQISSLGTPNMLQIKQALKAPWFHMKGPKSLDRNAFSLDIVKGLSVYDAAASLAYFTAYALRQAMQTAQKNPKLWVICGGGRHNPTIIKALKQAVTGQIKNAEAMGLDGDAIEAQAMAFLAMRSHQGKPISWPQTTGVSTPITGGVYFAPEPR